VNVKKIIPYPEERALEDAAYRQVTTPTRLFPLLLPVWCVEVTATVTHAEPYELIDRFLERGIAAGGLDTIADLARFFSLDEALVERAVRFLTRIQHVTTGSDGRLVLTRLGHDSVRDGRRYTIEQEDRRKLYFDAFDSRPLTRPYYDPSVVTLLTPQEVQDLKSRRDGPAFRMLYSSRVFRDAALTELARLTERDRFNLPERVDSPRRIDQPECVYLPLYLVRAVAPDGRARHLAYTQAGDTADADISEICERSPEVVGVIEAEESGAQDGRDEKRAREWLRRRGRDELRPVRLADGMLRVTFPASAFAPNGATTLSLSKLGSFVVQGHDFFQVWCGDERVRRRALLERVDSYLGARVRAERADAAGKIEQIARQLDLGRVDIPALRQMASRAGNRDLASHLDRIG
jgi:hypothetical protein